MSQDTHARLAELFERSVRVELFVVTSTLKVPLEEMGSAMDEHLEWAEGIEANGRIFAAGPLLGPDGESNGSALGILRGDSIEEVEQLVRSDPLVREGLREVRVHTWRLSRGTMTLRMNYLDSSFDLE